MPMKPQEDCDILRELVIVRWGKGLLTAVYENDILTELFFDQPDTQILGNIYVGKVKNIVKNINAAFIDFAPGQQPCGYYSLTENTGHYFLNPKKSPALVPGDELLVQVIKDPSKTKPAMLTGRFTLPGAYLILTARKCTVGISAKITDTAERQRLQAIVEPLVTTDYGFIVRTQAAGQESACIAGEAQKLARAYEALLKRASHATCFTKLKSAMPSYFKYIQSHPDIKKITTDVPEAYDMLASALEAHGLCIPFVYYQDEAWPLSKLKSLETHIERALNPRVWLKSGGSLIIQPTEAMVVIDVNTSRYTGKKQAQETYFKINMEAAREIARQLRLRNLSGIIIIDFIDMQEKAMRRQLLEELRQLLARDSVPTTLVDSTKLGLVELTRKKERRPLYELLGRVCPQCHGQGRIFENG